MAFKRLCACSLVGFALIVCNVATSFQLGNAFSTGSRYSIKAIASLLQGSLRSSDYKGASERRQESLEQGNNALYSLNLNLDALARSGAAPRAQELLARIHALYQEGYYEVSPDTVSYNSVLKAWKENDDPERAFELLAEMLQDNSNDSNIKPNVISFNTVIFAFARRGDYQQSLSMLRQMEQEEILPNPDTVTYNAVLYSYAQSQDPDAAFEAENLLKEMMHPASNVTVDTTSFNTVITAWSRLANKDAVDRACRSQHLLDHMESLAAAGNINVRPDEFSYTTVIQAWANCHKPLHAQQVLDNMLVQGLVPNRVTYGAVLSSLAKSGQAERAQELLEDMLFEYREGNIDMKPDTVSFSCVMDGYAKISSEHNPDAAEAALKLLRRMKSLEHEGMGPNSLTYTSVLTALAKSGRPDACDKARGLLEEVEFEYERGNYKLEPSRILYNSVLNAYARAPRADKGLKAFQFFKEMKQHPSPTCRPDIVSYNTLLLACAHAYGTPDLKEKSFRIALDAFRFIMLGKNDDNTMDDKVRLQPTSTTFLHFCKATRRLVYNKSSQKTILKKTFKLCCERGLVSPFVMQQVQMACSTDDEWADIVGEASTYINRKDRPDMSMLPKAWTCRARR